MDLEAYRNYCLSKEEVTETLPFDPTTLAYKVLGKIFTITAVDYFDSILVKCDPELAIEYRETYSSAIPDYHMNKKTLEYNSHGWNYS